MFACTRAVSTAAFSAAKVIEVRAVFSIFVSTHATTRMLLMLGFTASVPVPGHAANALSALASANPAAPAAVILRKSRRWFCMKNSF
jgi:tagatose-1,6-bisphosphate aldolase non-catalytic subunit AgaZ/GatZ